MDIEDKTFEMISKYAHTLHLNTQLEMEILSELADATFDTDLMEDTYHLKVKELKGVNVFTAENDFLLMTRHIEYVKDNLHTKVYEVPPLVTNDLLKWVSTRGLSRRALPHRLLGSEFVVAFVYSMLQRLYLTDIQDPKLLECLLYIIQTMALCKGDAPTATYRTSY